MFLKQFIPAIRVEVIEVLLDAVASLGKILYDIIDTSIELTEIQDEIKKVFLECVGQQSEAITALQEYVSSRVEFCIGDVLKIILNIIVNVLQEIPNLIASAVEIINKFITCNGNILCITVIATEAIKLFQTIVETIKEIIEQVASVISQIKNEAIQCFKEIFLETLNRFETIATAVSKCTTENTI